MAGAADLRRDWADFSIKQAPDREFPASHAALAYSVGDAVQVWSNGKGIWMDATVEAVYCLDTIADGYSVFAGTVKVSWATGLKYVPPEGVPTLLRKAERASSSSARPSSPSPASPGHMQHRKASSNAAGAGYSPRTTLQRPSGGRGGGLLGTDALRAMSSPTRRGSKNSGDGGTETSAMGSLCRNGCGRPVQPGLARGLRPYDTCCKRCAQNPGADVHDENSGQRRRISGRSSSSMSGVVRSKDSHQTFKRFLTSLLNEPSQMSQYVNGIFDQVSKGASRVDSQQAAAGLQALLSPFGIKQDISEWYAIEMCNKFRIASSADAKIGLTEFTSICQAVLEDRYSLWFPEILPILTSNFVKRNLHKLEDVYEMGKKLGQGTFGSVYEVRHKISGETRVCKQIAKSDKAMDYKQILQEIENMAMLDHPNVIKVYEYFDDAAYVSQIMEKCQGGELQDKVEELMSKGVASYDEAFICDVMKQTLRALAFMHHRRFLHKDLKPQNIMMVDKTANSSSIKVIDFGLAELFNASQEFAHSVGGTLLYMAPEVFKQEMTTKVDVWSAGVILYNLVAGDYPYMERWPPAEGKNEAWWQERTIEKIKNAQPPKHARFSKFSPDCIDLLCRMLRRDVESRPDATQCLEHPWFKKYSEIPPTLSVGVVQCVEAYARMGELKKAIFLLMAHQCAVDAIPELRALFTHFDFRNQGALSTADLHHVLVESGMSGLRAERVLHSLDRDDDGQILWTEFTAAAICVSICRSTRCVDAAFATMDADQDGKINAEDIIKVLAGTSGEVLKTWRRRMPQLMSEAKLPIVSAPSSAKDQSAFLDHKISRDQFRSFVGQKMDFRAGDALYAVT